MLKIKIMYAPFSKKKCSTVKINRFNEKKKTLDLVYG